MDEFKKIIITEFEITNINMMSYFLGLDKAM